MSLINRIKKARAKADKLSEKSKQAKSKGKDKRSANLEKRSVKKLKKADELAKKSPKDTSRKQSYKAEPRKKHINPSTFTMGAASAVKKAIQQQVENQKKLQDNSALQQELQRLEHKTPSHLQKPKPASNPRIDYSKAIINKKK